MTYEHQWRMPDSPAGRELEQIEGRPDAIETRGAAIETLGLQMSEAAVTLRMIADEQVGAGLSIEDLRSHAGELHADLATAGERYAPSGVALVEYARALRDAQSTIDVVLANCTELWEKVRLRQDDASEAERTPEADGDTSARDAAMETAASALTAASGEFDEEAARFDRAYDAWWTAYEKARRELQDVNKDGVKDGFWDNALPFIEGMVRILEIVGLALVIAALVVGGPFIAAIALVVGIVALVGTFILWSKKRASTTDLALAGLGVIPFGKLGKFATFASPGARFPRLAQFSKFMTGADDWGRVRNGFATINRNAADMWNAARQPGARPFHQISLGSQSLQRMMAANQFAGQQLPDLLRQPFSAKFLGVDGPVTAMSNLEFWGGLTGGMSNYVYSPLNTVAGAFADRESRIAVESWRS